MLLFLRNISKRKGPANEDKATTPEDNDPLGLGIIEKRILLPSNLREEGYSSHSRDNNGPLKSFSTVRDLASININVTDTLDVKPGKPVN